MPLLERDDPVFPLVDRRAPVLERLRNGRKNIADQLGKRVAQAAVTGDQPNEEFIQSFGDTIANELDIERDELNEDIVNDFANLFNVSLDNLVEAEDVNDDNEEVNEDQDSESEEVVEESEDSDDEDDDPDLMM